MAEQTIANKNTEKVDPSICFHMFRSFVNMCKAFEYINRSLNNDHSTLVRGQTNFYLRNAIKEIRITSTLLAESVDDEFQVDGSHTWQDVNLELFKSISNLTVDIGKLSEILFPMLMRGYEINYNTLLRLREIYKDVEGDSEIGLIECDKLYKQMVEFGQCTAKDLKLDIRNDFPDIFSRESLRRSVKLDNP